MYDVACATGCVCYLRKMVRQPSISTSSLSSDAHRVWIFLSYVALACAALVPRVLDLGRWVAGDEASFWFTRADAFLHALEGGNFAATAITSHPGVTTMWLGSAGIVLRHVLYNWNIITDQSFPTILTFFRLPMALMHTIGIVLGYWLLRRLFSPVTALLGALLWATDPFIIAFSRVLHVDGPAMTFATISLLAACCFWRREQRFGFFILSAVCAGLAVLSKWPAIALFPTVAVLACLSRWRLRTIKLLLIWGILVVATIFIGWPALWVHPADAYQALRYGVIKEGGEPHELGNFFLGQTVAAPGLSFYPLAFIMRLTPWTLLGLVLLIPALRYERRLIPARRDIGTFIFLVVFFIVALSVFPKKFNRYLVPIFPTVDILAAIGLAWGIAAAGALVRRLNVARALDRPLQAALLTFIGLIAVINIALWHPYAIAYFNPVFGGAQAGARIFLVGWGEGMEQVANWLNRQPDIKNVIVESTVLDPVQLYLEDGAQTITADALPPNAGYVVVDIRAVQGGLYPPFDQFYGRAKPLTTIQVHGVDYAWIYRAPPPVATSLPVDFGTAIHLRGFNLAEPVQPGQPLALQLSWQSRQPTTVDYMLFAHLIGSDGNVYARADLPYATSTWQEGQYVTTELPLGIPDGLPSGTYRLTVGLYDSTSGTRLNILGGVAAPPGLDGPDALLLTTIKVP